MRRVLPWLLILAACGGDDDDDVASDAAIDIDAPAACALAEPREREIDVGEVTLNVREQGCGPTVVLLHGFPEMAYGWQPIMTALADDYHVVAPDQRGYNLSEIPGEVTDYEIDHLDADILGLIDAVSTEPVLLVAHDWGGAVAWVFANRHPEKLRGLVIMNAPHPDVFANLLATDADQQQASQYMNFFIGDSAEGFLSANNYAGLIGAFNGALSPDQEDAYRAGYAQPGSVQGMLNWYGANIDTGPVTKDHWPTDVTISVPTRVVWGMADTALLPGNVNGLDAYVSDLTVIELEGIDHWVPLRAEDDVVSAIRAME